MRSPDLWQLPADRLTTSLTDQLERKFYERCPPEKRPGAWRDDQQARQSPVFSPHEAVDIRRSSLDKQSRDEKLDADVEGATTSEAAPNDVNNLPGKQKAYKDRQPAYDESLIKALNQCYFWLWWTAGILTLFASASQYDFWGDYTNTHISSDTLQTTTPLVNQKLLTWLEERYYFWKSAPSDRDLLSHPHGIGYGIGLAFAIFVMQEAASLMTCHFTLMSMEVGLLIRTSVIGAIYRKSLRLSAQRRRIRSTMPEGRE